MPAALLTLKRAQRLNQQADFKQLFDHSTYRLSNHAFLLLARYNNREYARLGIVVGKRAAKRAIERNYIKRLFRETFRIKQQELKGMDLLLLLRSGWKKNHPESLNAQLDKLFLDLLAKVHED